MLERTYSLRVIVDAYELQSYRPQVLRAFDRSRDRLIQSLGPQWDVGNLTVREESVEPDHNGRWAIPRIQLSGTCIAVKAD